jgi:hypothetical protein
MATRRCNRAIGTTIKKAELRVDAVQQPTD